MVSLDCQDRRSFAIASIGRSSLGTSLELRLNSTHSALLWLDSVWGSHDGGVANDGYEGAK